MYHCHKVVDIIFLCLYFILISTLFSILTCFRVYPRSVFRLFQRFTHHLQGNEVDALCGPECTLAMAVRVESVEHLLSREKGRLSDIRISFKVGERGGVWNVELPN